MKTESSSAFELSFRVVDRVASDSSKKVQEGVFSRDWDGEAAVDKLSESIEAGRLTAEKALLQARRLQPSSPGNLELHNFIGCHLWEMGMRDEAHDVYRKAYADACALIPKGFKGRIDWLWMENRSFLRLAHGLLLALVHEGDGRAAMKQARRLLRWCPGDNLGVRYLLGDIALLKGDFKVALREYLGHAEESPACWYQAGLIQLRARDFVSACTFLRRGIAANPYIAEGLTGRNVLGEHLYWHGGNVCGPDWAIDYLNSPACDWDEHEIDFVDWVFNASGVLKERSEVTSLHEALTYLRVGDERSAAVTALTDFSKGITDELSEAMVRKVSNRWDQEVWPWDRMGLDHPVLFDTTSPWAGVEQDR